MGNLLTACSQPVTDIEANLEAALERVMDHAVDRFVDRLIASRIPAPEIISTNINEPKPV